MQPAGVAAERDNSHQRSGYGARVARGGGGSSAQSRAPARGDVCAREIWGGRETRQLLLRSTTVVARGAIDWQPASATVSPAPQKSKSPPRICERAQKS